VRLSAARYSAWRIGATSVVANNAPGLFGQPGFGMLRMRSSIDDPAVAEPLNFRLIKL
jgi:hypothetical protein